VAIGTTHVFSNYKGPHLARAPSLKVKRNAYQSLQAVTQARNFAGDSKFVYLCFTNQSSCYAMRKIITIMLVTGLRRLEKCHAPEAKPTSLTPNSFIR